MKNLEYLRNLDITMQEWWEKKHEWLFEENKGRYDFYCEEVLSWKIEVEKLYEDEIILAYFHTKPFWEKHIVIIPKKHIPDLVACTDQDLLIVNQIIRTARNLAKNLNMSEWVQLLTNMWKFQDTPHLHFHLAQGKKLR